MSIYIYIYIYIYIFEIQKKEEEVFTTFIHFTFHCLKSKLRCFDIFRNCDYLILWAKVIRVLWIFIAD